MDKLRQDNNRAASIVKAVQGAKKPELVATAIVNSRMGKLAESQHEILKCSLDYCSDVLTKNTPSGEYIFESHMRNNIHCKRMKRNNPSSDIALTRTMFDGAIERFKKKSKKCYDFVTNVQRCIV